MDTTGLEKIARAFDTRGELKETKQIVQGHINTTYRLLYEDGAERVPYTLQAINRYVFKNPELVMENICAVTDFLREKIRAAHGDPDRETLRVIPTRDGKSFYIDGDGEYWRLYNFIDGATTYDTVQDIRHLRNAGYAFGRFQTLLADFPIERLHDTIPDFHNTKKRFDDFFAAVREDKTGRVASVLPEIEFLEQRRGAAARLGEMAARGELPMRVTHNDTKYNNILIDDRTNEALCVIDLDTVMPGLAAYDFGDAIRFAASTAAEDETDLSKIALDMELFSEFTAGFVGAVSGFLTENEILTLPLGVTTITLELASRFLMDHINGDAYFKIHRENHNLDRARSQLALAADMERNYGRMEEIVRKYI